ncbi:hypothetical protein PGTUg99_025803 [Puccinia graminis f. sp. tritici]|uniref:BCAS3 WD40 domain-containing protein n=1 Tax=Puccinia graminis f. sp. tritici TaxID=56615 RepID=A0A5B0SK02_PUCGR|nr:hypothetical protein PGTUg99_025803 [Puccinia graminis f. sp. tritici]
MAFMLGLRNRSIPSPLTSTSSNCNNLNLNPNINLNINLNKNQQSQAIEVLANRISEERHSMYQSTNQTTKNHEQRTATSTKQQPPIICSPSLIREPTTFESFTTTLQSFSLPTFSSPFRSSHHNNLPPHDAWINSTRPNQPINLPSNPHHPQQQQQQLKQYPLTDPDRITFSTWFNFNQRRHLLSINPVGIAIWDTQDLEALVQVSWIRWDHLRQQKTRPPSHHPFESVEPLITPYHSLQFQNLEPVSASVLPSIDPSSPQMLFAILFNSLLDRSSKLIIISANSAIILHSLDLPGIALELKTNQKLIAIATKSPLALHLYRWDLREPSEDLASPPSNPQLSLSKLACSPILDLAPKPKTGNPVFNLGQSRLLVYASSKPPSEREPPIATGPGFSFAFPAQIDPRSPSNAEFGRAESKESNFGLPSTYSATRHSSHTGISGSSWKNSVTPNLDAIDETARKLGGGLLTGAKYLSSWGQNLWSPHIDNLHSSRQGLHHLPRSNLDPAFSQSAPLPHMMSAARPTPSARPEEVHGTYGNVKVIDLFSNDPSSTSHGHRHHQPIFHFKSSSDPLTFLSFNPSSSLLLTSSIEGHSFHVFELRPHSRVGRSYLNSCRPNHPSLSSREATVWHRYKLTRGFTSAEVTDVVWRWDSKIVSVLTEHGTHHLFAIHPAGGAPTTNIGEAGKSPRGTIEPISAIFSPRVHNPRAPQPLSVTVSAFDKIKHKSMRHHSFLQHPDSAASLGYLDYHPNEHETLGHLHHTSLVFAQPKSFNSSQNHSEEILSESHKRSPSVLLHEPLTNSVTLYNFESKKKLLDSVAGGVSSSMSKTSTSLGGTSSSENQTIPSAEVKNKQGLVTTPSGLSQLMMQQTKQMEPKLNGHELTSPPGNLVVSSFAPAVWHLSAMEDPRMNTVNRLYQSLLGSTSSSQPSKLPSPDSKLGYMVHRTNHSGQNWTSFAELDTFSHSLRILPRSIYICHQFDFYHFAPLSQLSSSTSHHHHHAYHPSSHEHSFIEQLSKANFDHIKKNKLVVKQEVQIQPGDLSTHQESVDLFGLRTVEIDDHFVNHHSTTGPPGSNGSSDSNNQHHQIYAEPLRSAVETVLDSTITSPRRSSQNFPEFPNGHPGRRSGPSGGSQHNPLASLKKSVAENVVPVVGVVNERFRKEIEKITTSGRGVIGSANRRRISVGMNYCNGMMSHTRRAGGGGGSESFEGSSGGEVVAYGSEETTSVSFEEDEAIRIDRESFFDDQRPSSSSMSSFDTSMDRLPGLSDETQPAPSDELEPSPPAALGENWDGWTFEDDAELIGALPPAQRLADKLPDPFLFNPPPHHRHLTLPPVILPSSTATTTTAILPPPLTPSSKPSSNLSLVEAHSLVNPQPQPVEPSTSSSSKADQDTALPASETLIHSESQLQSKSGGLGGDTKEEQACVLKTSSASASSATLLPDPIHPTSVKSAAKSDPKSAASGSSAAGSSASGSSASAARRS